MSYILCVGIAALDIINYVSQYPGENDEVRANAQRIARGGNAANTACVLSQLGQKAEFVGTLAEDEAARLIAQDLTACGVGIHDCPRIPDSASPVSYITLSEASGSRTIVHYRDLPELSFGEFSTIDPAIFDWFHFEGRNTTELKKMLDHVHAHRVDQPVSIEVEKEREGIDALLALGDVLIFSRDFVRGRGYDDAETFFNELRPELPEALLIAPWGEEGAYASEPGQAVVHASAQAPQRIVDTVGAGDTFNAGLIHGLSDGQPLNQALGGAVRLAGRKIAQHGFAGLGAASLS